MLDSGVRALNKTVDRTESRDGVGGGGSNCSGRERRGQRQDLPPHCAARCEEEGGGSKFLLLQWSLQVGLNGGTNGHKFTQPME